MNPFSNRSARSILAVALLAVVLSASTGAAEEAKRRDVLWDIVTNCLDPGTPNYCEKCRWPRAETSCAALIICKDTTDVWAQTAEYVALRDRKMCGCPDDFVHGLAIPRTPVTGVEDPRHPDGIWPFAWEVALRRIPEPREAALAVNPPGLRAQDQLHVHIVRLQQGARQNFCSNYMARVPNLDHVWADAARIADSAGMSQYGILVTTHPEGGFIVLVDRKSPEKEYVQEGCRDKK